MLTKIYYVTIRGTITCITGMHIGGSSETLEIGSVDQTIIRHPFTGEAYIPGSSLKGKLRSLLEYRHGRRDKEEREKGRVRDNGEPCECAKCKICLVFGPHKHSRHTLGPSRALFRDASLTEQWRQKFQEIPETGGMIDSEIKTETMINRQSNAAQHPRTVERVPAGTSFEFEIVIRLFEGDNEGEITDLLKEGLKLLEHDYLGASGSRGYGQVKIDYTVRKES